MYVLCIYIICTHGVYTRPQLEYLQTNLSSFGGHQPPTLRSPSSWLRPPHHPVPAWGLSINGHFIRNMMINMLIYQGYVGFLMG